MISSAENKRIKLDHSDSEQRNESRNGSSAQGGASQWADLRHRHHEHLRGLHLEGEEEQQRTKEGIQYEIEREGWEGVRGVGAGAGAGDAGGDV